MNNIRNFCIIAHIDHGKSTLADRMLELTNTVEKRKMKAQILDRMDIERERGITIKLQPVTMLHKDHILNMIDTPGHVDFTYEVSRSLAAVEGAILLVDATQGIQAQTLANLYLAIEQDLAIIPVVNKIDLPAADKEKTKREIIELLGCKENEILYASGKTGAGVDLILDRIITDIPDPRNSGENGALRALIFDSTFDEYKGVVAYVRVMDGSVKKGEKIKLMASGAESEALDVGIFKPDYLATGELKTGEIGYIVTGFKDISECRVGDTVTQIKGAPADLKPLQGYKEVKPMVFAGIFPKEGNEFQELRDGIEKLKLNDASLFYEPEHSQALGFGFRCGFLGILHLEVFQERLKREYGLELIVTLPSVAYKVYKKNGESFVMRTPQQFPDRETVERIEEPWVKLDIITPKDYVGGIMNLAQEKRGIYKNTEYIDATRAIMHYEIPMSAILTDFYDKIKSVSSGYASINYEFTDYRETEVVKMDILVAEEGVEALSAIVYEDEVFNRGKEIVNTLKDNLPKQMFAIKLQAAVGGKVVAAEKISALRKDVTAKLYGGDVTRKRKLLEKQKKGKKKMMAAGKGSVDIPSDVFVKILKK
ncbi:elongation factor 4 [Candidatus Falkowbacteria bacterium RIFOXYB2_FULL_47_14]|uniref:Elongation factor 4 n=1 Tax=Candidatus Falkowbacteria bacterium RIFOXYA2_FULL_47_19 TaxID=1797994 RepID=A0A1F5SL28_9BACT|nr:MAG: elongation factor 4 [Candidatus Falkowbacteria bacterium RIFOXYA2_FULL_47_19]OGF36904.1 MAG: elongation factor 4 [Candidatus Falkowbacteria bacterium RIFOXYC2_FULL_46_15]OGF43392.1 MAG: elongation factor 4 [Candidatus Falkowbacteria bacterium RIFOXYB2_FULL_47_14]